MFSFSRLLFWVRILSLQIEVVVSLVQVSWSFFWNCCVSILSVILCCCFILVTPAVFQSQSTWLEIVVHTCCIMSACLRANASKRIEFHTQNVVLKVVYQLYKGALSVFDLILLLIHTFYAFIFYLVCWSFFHNIFMRNLSWMLYANQYNHSKDITEVYWSISII